MSVQEESASNFIAKFGTHVVTERDLLTELKYRTSWNLIGFALERKIVNELIQEHSIELEDEEIYEFMDAFRAKNDLYSEEEIDSWLTQNNMDDDEFFEFCRYEASLEILKSKLFPEEKILETFAFKRLELDAVELYHIMVPDLDLAQEILAQSKEGETFFDLAHRFNTDEVSKKTCGYLGLNRRSDLRAEVAGNVFGAKKGAVLGPFKGTNGYYLYLVDDIVFAQFDEETKTKLVDDFFKSYMSSKISASEIEYPGSVE